MRKIIIFLIVGFFLGQAHGQTWYELDDGTLVMEHKGKIRIRFPSTGLLVPTNYSIQEAIKIAKPNSCITIVEPLDRIFLDGAPENLTIKGSVQIAGIDTSGAGSGLIIKGFRISSESKYAIWINSDSVSILDCYIFDTNFAIAVNHKEPWVAGGLIKGNHIYEASMGLSIHGDDWIIEDNEIERIRLYDLDPHDSDYSRAFGNNIIFRRNYFHNTLLEELKYSDGRYSHTDGMQTFTNNNAGATNFLFENNFVKGFSQGMMLEGNVSGIVKGNIFIGDWGGAWGINAKGLSFIEIKGNYFIDMKYHGAVLRSGTKGIIQNNYFYNAGSNYWSDSILIGGYNHINKESYPFYKEETDIIGPFNLTVIEPTGMPFNIEDCIRIEL